MYELILEETDDLNITIRNSKRKVYKLMNDAESLMKKEYTPVSTNMSTEGEITNTFIQFFSFIMKRLKRVVFKESINLNDGRIYSFLLFEDEDIEKEDDPLGNNKNIKMKEILRKLFYIILAIFSILFILGIFAKKIYTYVFNQINNYFDPEFLVVKYLPEEHKNLFKKYRRLSIEMRENVSKRENIFKQISERYNQLKEENLKNLPKNTQNLPFFTRIKISLIAFKDIIFRILKEGFFATLILPIAMICKLSGLLSFYKILLSLTSKALMKKVEEK